MTPIDVESTAGNAVTKEGVIEPVGAGTKCIPPIPVPAASHAPIVAGTGSGTNSAIRVGWVVTLVASQRKSSRNPCSNLERFKRGLVGSSCRKASCSSEKRPTKLRSAIDIEWSSFSTLCQSLVEIVFCSGVMESRISRRRSMRCGGSVIVLAKVSMSHRLKEVS